VTRASRRPTALLLAGLLLAGAAQAGQEDADVHRECNHCGMDRRAYGYSRMLIRFADGGEAGVCSLHCALVELEGAPGRAVAALLVADRDGRELLPVEGATWVLGGAKRGLMTARAKWAFASPGAAAAFVREHGGAVVSWEAARQAAADDLAEERRLLRARRERASGCAGTPRAG
jgi:nitrous oxide reductase accessory protein NosL